MVQAARRRGRPFALTYEQIGDAVLELGLETFSAKELAAHLGVAEKTLYNYAPGRTGLLTLGMEQAMRRSPAAPRVFWTADTGWRELLEGVADQAWRFLNAEPGVGVLIAQGIHSRAEAEFSARAGNALLERGFDADQALDALVLVFDLVVAAAVHTAQRAVAPPVWRRRGQDADPGGDRSPVGEEFSAAIERAMGQSSKAVLDRRLAVVLDGMSARYGHD